MIVVVDSLFPDKPDANRAEVSFSSGESWDGPKSHHSFRPTVRINLVGDKAWRPDAAEELGNAIVAAARMARQSAR